MHAAMPSQGYMAAWQRQLMPPRSCPMNLHHVCCACAGKTSTALAIARQLDGPELRKTRVMELNASDERGINVVRQKVCAAAASEHSRQQCVCIRATFACGLLAALQNRLMQPV